MSSMLEGIALRQRKVIDANHRGRNSWVARPRSSALRRSLSYGLRKTHAQARHGFPRADVGRTDADPLRHRADAPSGGRRRQPGDMTGSSGRGVKWVRARASSPIALLAFSRVETACRILSPDNQRLRITPRPRARPSAARCAAAGQWPPRSQAWFRGTSEGRRESVDNRVSAKRIRRH
jgi:hypothetical protein